MSSEPLNCSGCCRRRAGARSGEGDHERTVGLGAEGNPKAAATADAMDLGPALCPRPGGAGHKAHSLVAEHPRRIGRQHEDRRDALPVSPFAAACRTAA